MKEDEVTDLIKGLIVTFEKDIREDDAEAIIKAIQQLRAVADVRGSVSSPDDLMNQQRAKYELKEKMYNVLLDA